MQLHQLDESRSPTAAVIVDTTELRWFADGALPIDVVAWFTSGGEVGVREQRTDTYRLDDRQDIGVKRRFQNTLELKARRSVGLWCVLGDGLGAQLETWRRWSPADGLIDSGVDDTWIDVHKLVHKRRISSMGEEILWSNGAPPEIGAGCDVEVAAVTVGDVEAWTFSLAAFGPEERHGHAMEVAWRNLLAGSECPAGFEASFDLSCGYPEWLTRHGSRSTLISADTLGKQLVA